MSVKRSVLTVLLPLFVSVALLPLPAAAQTTLNFEGLTDEQPIGTIQGITFSPNWLAINSCSVGGDGNFISPPSGVGIAYVLEGGGGTAGTITFSTTVYKVSTRFVSRASPLTITALDAAGHILAEETEPATAFADTGQCGLLDTWGTFAFESDTPIASVRIHDTGNFFAIDDFTIGPAIQITLVPEPPDDRYVIDATPAMPTIRAKAKVVNVSPDPTPMTTFTWQAKLTIEKKKGGSVQIFDYSGDIRQDLTTTGDALYTLTFNDPDMFRGVDLQLTATATVNGTPLKGKTPSDLRIHGTNPQRSDIQGYIDLVVPPGGFLGLQAPDVEDVLKRMACQESNQIQFQAAADGGIGPPLVSFDNGVGIFQITDNNPLRNAPDFVFDWQLNVVGGERIYRTEKAVTANKYPNVMRASTSYRSLVTNVINPARVANHLKPIPGFPAPAFTTAGLIGSNPPNQLLEDAVRGYNGFAGTPYFVPPGQKGPQLHEFIPDEDFLKAVPDAEVSGLDRDRRVWRRVMVGERPPPPCVNCQCTPNYVGCVTSRSPQCGG